MHSPQNLHFAPAHCLQHQGPRSDNARGFDEYLGRSIGQEVHWRMECRLRPIGARQTAIGADWTRGATRLPWCWRAVRSRHTQAVRAALAKPVGQTWQLVAAVAVWKEPGPQAAIKVKQKHNKQADVDTVASQQKKRMFPPSKLPRPR